MLTKHIIEKIDYAIKYAWMNQIADDYNACAILKEDSLKNSFYHHLRNALDPLCRENNIRIYTEFNEKGLKSKGLRADIAIVSLIPHKNDNYFLGERIGNVLAIIELKFKGDRSTGTSAIYKDVDKTKNYIKKFAFPECQYYLGVIHVYSYSFSELRWLDKRQSNNWGKGRLTELNACYYEEHGDMISDFLFARITN
jgi:hypothetical protein